MEYEHCFVSTPFKKTTKITVLFLPLRPFLGMVSNNARLINFLLFWPMFVSLYTTPKNPISADIWGGPFFFFFGSNQRERYFSMEHGRWKVAWRSLHQLPQPPPETFDDDNPQPPKINWSP